MPEARTDTDPFERFIARVLSRRAARIAVILLFALYASAIFAPLIANDRPFVLDAIDLGGYQAARRSLVPILETLNELVSREIDEHERADGTISTDHASDSIAAESAALVQRLATMRAYLSPADRSALDACESSIRAADDLRRAGRGIEARDEIGRARAAAREIERELAPRDPAHPERGGKTLHGATTHPLFDALRPIDVFGMLAWLIAATAFVWNRAVDALVLRRDPSRVRAAFATKLVACALLALGGATVWALVPHARSSFSSAPYKSAIARGELIVERAVFPPIAMGFAETHASEANRPPTWLSSAEISDEGYYVRGPRAPRTDAITGYRPPPAPVEVRSGELARNAALRHPLGTDSLGRDVLVRLLWGGRTSLAVGLAAALVLTLLGTSIGAAAGYCGGRIDALISRAIEIVLCVPAFFLILSVIAFTDPDVVPPIGAIVIVIGLVAWTGVARLVRAEFLRLRELEFVLAARAMGFSPWRIALRHMLPNAMGPVLVAAAFAVASSTLYESALSFLGLGVAHPIPSWGALINDSHSAEQWWIQLFPGLCLFATVLAYNLLGEGLRDALDPRSPS
jgi:peptide/nickel transport system permease protein